MRTGSMTRRSSRIAATLLLLFPPFLVAQDTSGWAKLGEFIGGGIDREGAFNEGQRQRAQIERAYWAERSRQAQEESARLTQQTREWLARQWLSFGFSSESATAIAAVYSPSDMDAAITATTRSKGSDSVFPVIRKALDEYNYQLANQLAIAWLVVQTEERAVRSDATRR